MSALETKPRKSRWQPSIRQYLVSMHLLLLCLLFPVATLLFFDQVIAIRDLQLERSLAQMRKSLEDRGGSMARHLALSAGQALAGYDFTFLSILLAEVVKRDQEIAYCLIVDESGRIISHSDPLLIGGEFADLKIGTALSPAAVGFPETLDSGRPEAIDIVETEAQVKGQPSRVLEMIVPVYSGLRLSGVMHLGYSMEGLHRENESIRADWKKKMEQFSFSIISLASLFFALGLVIALGTTARFEKAARILNTGVARITEGELDHHIPDQGLFCRELTDYGQAFNSMTGRLRDSLRELESYSRSLEEKVVERTRALQQAQNEMLSRAHEAGMAEMAVGVLHNIGNAITPAKVGAALLVWRLQQSPLRNQLDKAMEQAADGLLEQGNLSEQDRKRLSEVVRLLPGSLREEYDRMAQEIQRIRDKHEHIENIISLQMRYTRLVGEREDINVNQVITDALKLLEDSLQNRKINVVRQEGVVPTVRFEQAKLIQVVINMVKNAYEAMHDSPEEKKITITTGYEEVPAKQVVISIRDTGCGFDPGDAEKLFKFGYTTKSDGSGFGLHSCANFIRAQKGSITAHSDGHGKGAVFTVRLPVETGDVVIQMTDDRG